MTAAVAVLRADLADALQELDRADAHGDAAAIARTRVSVNRRIDQLRRAITTAERLDRTTTEVDHENN